MTLYELGEEYIRQADLVAKQTAKLKSNLTLYTGYDLLEQRGKILKLSSMSRECRRTGEYLMNYYTDGANVLHYVQPFEEIKVIQKF